jgi:acyl-CoA reductase-like NAD-dependent aldehyde dehydrogenase
LLLALMRAGAPPEAFCYYPSSHAGGAEILRHTGRGIVFGDASTTKAWQGDPRIERHGPGYSKVVIGEDCIDDWPQYLDVIVRSILDNGGRSCVNASGVWVPRRADEIAEVLAERLAGVTPRPADDERAEIAPFVDAGVARRISEQIDRGLAEPGARDVTAARRPGSRLAVTGGCTYLLPTIVRCSAPDHALANKEYLFPFASVLEVSQDQMPDLFGPTLVVTAITRDPALVRRLVDSPLVDRLNVGAIPTNRLTWDQPHEGNLFEHLYGRRAYQQIAV